MIIAADIGNSTVVFGVLEEGQVLCSGSLSSNRSSTQEEYAAAVQGMFQRYGVDCRQAEGAILSSVVPELTETISDVLEELTGRLPLLLGSLKDKGIRLRVDQPSAVGQDRIADAVAGLREYELPLMICDLGTATTCSVVDSDGSFAGGIICPGVRTAHEALTARASQLSGVAFEPPENIVGRNTEDCIKSGIVYGNAAMLDGLIDRIEESMGERLHVVATGGLAPAIIPWCRHEIIYDKHLLLKGLWYLYQENNPCAQPLFGAAFAYDEAPRKEL